MEQTILLIPAEVNIAGVYLPPLLLASIFGVAGAALTAIMLNRYRLTRYFYCPPVIFLSLAVIYTGLIGTILIPV
jgi:hypothetical protein